MHVNELRHQFCLQLGVSPQTSEGDVVHPLVPHWEREQFRVELWELAGFDSVRISLTRSIPTGTGPSHIKRNVAFPE